MKRFIYISGVLVLAAALVVLLLLRKNEISEKVGSPWIGSLFAGEAEYVVSQKIEKGVAFANLAEAFGLAGSEINNLLEAAKNKYDLAKIVEGRELSFVSDKETGEFKKLVYQIDSEETLLLGKNNTGEWNAERLPIPYTVTEEEVAGRIDSSLFETITRSGGDDRLALALAEVFAWQIDFGADIQTGDEFKVTYEKRSINGNYIGPGKILAAKFTNDGRVFKGVYFASPSGEEGYYDEVGLSLHKIFLKSPLSYKYISSGFSYNRSNPVTRTLHAHRAIDYAAPYGTPVLSVGDGIVAYAGSKGKLGNIVQVRHNDTYTTVYAHFSRVAVRSGAKVKQGQIIGYVGATGQATGPHLHFEMYKNGAYVNPLTIELPPGDPVAETEKPAFEAAFGKYKDFFES